MTDYNEIVETAKAWQDAEHNYHEEVSKHVVAWWGDNVPPNPPEPMTVESLAKLQDLRKEIDVKLAQYRAAVARKFPS